MWLHWLEDALGRWVIYDSFNAFLWQHVVGWYDIEEWKWCIQWHSNGSKPHSLSFLIGCGHVSIYPAIHPIHTYTYAYIYVVTTGLLRVSTTYSSMALFHMITYPDKMKDSMLTMCVFPRSVPTYSHLLWKGRWQNVILENKRKRKSLLESNNYKCSKTILKVFFLISTCGTTISGCFRL